MCITSVSLIYLTSLCFILSVRISVSHQLISQEELQITIDYLNYNGPLKTVTPPDSETERKKGLAKAVATSAF